MHASIADLVLEVASNAIEAGAGRVALTLRESPQRFAVEVRDNGKGMRADQLAACFDPRFTEAGKHAARPRGFGLAFLQQSIEATGGTLSIRSTPGAGTTIRFGFDFGHPDTPPIGDLPGTLLLVLAYPGQHELLIRRTRGKRRWAVTRKTLIRALDDLEHAENLLAARRYLKTLETD